MPVLETDVRFENRQFASTFNLGPVSFDVLAGLEINIENGPTPQNIPLGIIPVERRQGIPAAFDRTKQGG